MKARPQQNQESIAKRVVERYDEGIKLAANFRNRIDLLAPYIEPTRSNTQFQQANGAALMSRMYDSEGISSADLAVRQIGSYLHGPGSTWFGLEDESEEVNADDEAREWYEYCRDLMLKAASAGFFYPESYETDMDWIGFGTGAMLTEQRPQLAGHNAVFGWRGARFQHIRAGHFVIFENGIGQVDEIYFELKKSAKAAADLWGLENLSDDMQEAYRNGKADEFKFIHGIYPRKQNDRTYGNKAMPWGSCYVAYEKKKLVGEGGYEEFPAQVPRWTRCFGEPNGRGLGEIALNDLITLNASEKADIEAATLTIKPPLAVRNDAVIGARKFTPWGVTVVRTAPGENVAHAIAPINMLGRFEYMQLKEDQKRKSIRRIFYADALEQLMTFEGQQEMRVYVFQQKQGIVQKMLGPTYGRWEAEFGIPWVSRLFNMMYRAGVFPQPPDIILQMGGQPRVRFDSPLARAQRMEEIDAMNSAIQGLRPIVELQANEWKMTGRQPHAWVLDAYNFDKYTEKVNRNYGVPAIVTNSGREIAAIRQSRAEAERVAQQSQQLAMLAEGAGKAAPALKLLQGGAEAA